MTSYLVDLILLVALLFTSVRVTKMHRELVRLRAYQGEFSAIVDRAMEAFDTIALSMDDLSANGNELVNALSRKVEEAREAIAELDQRRNGPEFGGAAKPAEGADMPRGFALRNAVVDAGR